MDVFGSLLWLMLMVIGIGVLALYVYQRWMVYVPYIPGNPRNEFEKPEDHGISPELVTNIQFTSLDGEQLHGFFIMHPKATETNPKLPVIYYLHENAGNLSHRFPNVKSMLDRLEMHVFIISYRGYGDSTGVPSEAAFLLDTMAGLRWLRESKSATVDRDNIFLFGRSLGGAAALSLAAELNRTESDLKIRGLIIENSFSSVPELMVHLMPLIASMSTLVTNVWNSAARVKELSPNLPCLFISGGSDELIPPTMVTDLFERCSSKKKEIVSFPGGSHMGTWEQPGYWASVVRFVNQTVSK